jgi:hypothetical protein
MYLLHQTLCQHMAKNRRKKPLIVKKRIMNTFLNVQSVLITSSHNYKKQLLCFIENTVEPV